MYLKLFSRTDHSNTEPVDKNTRWLTKKSQTIPNLNNSTTEQLWTIQNVNMLGIWAPTMLWKWFVSPCYDCRFWPEFFRLRWGTWVHPPVRPPSCWRKRPSGGGRQTNRDWKNQVLSFGVRFSNGSGQPFKNRTKMSSFQTIVRIFHLILDQFIFLCNGIRWPLFLLFTLQFTVLINHLCILDTTLSNTGHTMELHVMH